jgi:toxin ParE1/3/4
MKPFWTKLAKRELIAIKLFIAANNPSAAEKLVATIKAKAHAACENPQANRIVPELGSPEIREALIGNYRLVYRIKENQLSFLSVTEGHRLFRLK